MPEREYRCAECAGVFTHECRGRPRVCCEDCAPIRKARQIAEWGHTHPRRDLLADEREAARARAIAWNRSHPERRAAIVAKYSKKPEVRVRQNERNRARHIRHFAPVLLADPCSYCGGPAQHLDHIVPMARGGENSVGNLTAACGPCNRSKHARSLLTFLLDTR